MLFSCAIVDFLFFSMMWLLICKYEFPLGQCRVSDTQVTIKVCGPLVVEVFCTRYMSFKISKDFIMNVNF